MCWLISCCFGQNVMLFDLLYDSQLQKKYGTTMNVIWFSTNRNTNRYKIIHNKSYVNHTSPSDSMFHFWVLGKLEHHATMRMLLRRWMWCDILSQSGIVSYTGGTGAGPIYVVISIYMMNTSEYIYRNCYVVKDVWFQFLAWKWWRHTAPRNHRWYISSTRDQNPHNVIWNFVVGYIFTGCTDRI